MFFHSTLYSAILSSHPNSCLSTCFIRWLIFYHFIVHLWKIQVKTQKIGCHLWNAPKNRVKNRSFLPQFLIIFCLKTTTSCGQALLFLLRTTIRHHYYTLNMAREDSIDVFRAVRSRKQIHGIFSFEVLGNISTWIILL